MNHKFIISFIIYAFLTVTAVLYYAENNRLILLTVVYPLGALVGVALTSLIDNNGED